MTQSAAHILLVDNVEQVVSQYSNLLESGSLTRYRVAGATTLDQAREKLREESFDLAIVDVRMVDDSDETDQSGYQFALEIIRNIKIPVIVITSEPDFGLIRQREADLRNIDLAQINFWGKSEPEGELVRLIAATLRGRRVFVVHGHDHTTRLEVENLLLRLGLYPIQSSFRRRLLTG